MRRVRHFQENELLKLKRQKKKDVEELEKKKQKQEKLAERMALFGGGVQTQNVPVSNTNKKLVQNRRAVKQNGARSGAKMARQFATGGLRANLLKRGVKRRTVEETKDIDNSSKRKSISIPKTEIYKSTAFQSKRNSVGSKENEEIKVEIKEKEITPKVEERIHVEIPKEQPQPDIDISKEPKAEEQKIDVPKEPIAKEQKQSDIDISKEPKAKEQQIDIPKEPIAKEQKQSDIDIPKEPIAKEQQIDIPKEPIAKEQKQSDIDIPKETIAKEHPQQSDIEVPEGAQQSDITIPIANEPKQLHINAHEQPVHLEKDESIQSEELEGKGKTQQLQSEEVQSEQDSREHSSSPPPLPKRPSLPPPKPHRSATLPNLGIGIPPKPSAPRPKPQGFIPPKPLRPKPQGFIPPKPLRPKPLRMNSASVPMKKPPRPTSSPRKNRRRSSVMGSTSNRTINANYKKIRQPEQDLFLETCHPVKISAISDQVNPFSEADSLQISFSNENNFDLGEAFCVNGNDDDNESHLNENKFQLHLEELHQRLQNIDDTNGNKEPKEQISETRVLMEGKVAKVKAISKRMVNKMCCLDTDGNVHLGSVVKSDRVDKSFSLTAGTQIVEKPVINQLTLKNATKSLTLKMPTPSDYEKWRCIFLQFLTMKKFESSSF